MIDKFLIFSFQIQQMMRFKIIFIFTFFSLLKILNAQEAQPANKRIIFSLNFGIGSSLTGGKLSERFGPSTAIDVGGEYYLNQKSSLLIDYAVNFGSDVREDIFKPFRNENGNVIGINGLGSNAYLRMRSNFAGVSFGHLFSKSTSGIKLIAGGGLFSHYIRVIDDSRNLAIANKNFFKGFDRLSRGPAFKSDLMYSYNSKTSNLHFNIGVGVILGFTKQVRTINYDSVPVDLNSRIDALYSIKANWVLPILKEKFHETKYF
jgi:hypothetical protein